MTPEQIVEKVMQLIDEETRDIDKGDYKQVLYDVADDCMARLAAMDEEEN